MRVDWLSVAAGGALLAAAVLLAAACAGAAQVPTVDPRYGGGLGLCVADVALAKEAMKKTDAGVDKAKLWDRYEACTHNVEQVFGLDAAAATGGQ
jgi:hypothetical protein